MGLILNIDTALEQSSLCIARDEQVLDLVINDNQKDNAAWPHTIIADLLKKNQVTARELNAVAVSIGPGSYTGLRVGLAAAKGLCYALNIPLITVGTLEVIAYSVKDEAMEFICPLIDARRMEVFTALYTKDLIEKMPPQAMIIDENSFADLLSSPILFCGTGSKKLQALLKNSPARFSETASNASHLAMLAKNLFSAKKFANLVYTDPLYIKEFYAPGRKIS